MHIDVTQGIDFHNGHVHWNELALDPDRPFDDQIVGEDALYVTFPNGAGVDVSWFGNVGVFAVNVVQEDREDHRELDEQRCTVLTELRQIIARAVSIAVALPSTQRPVIKEHEIQSGMVETNSLYLDPMRPLSDQLASLPDELLEITFGLRDLALTVRRSNFPPYMPEVILHRTPAWDFDEAGNYRHRTHLWVAQSRRTCRSVPELRETLLEFIKIVMESEIAEQDGLS